VKDERRGREAAAFRDLRASGFPSCANYWRLDVKDERRGREAAAFRDLRATGIRASGFRSCANY